MRLIIRFKFRRSYVARYVMDFLILNIYLPRYFSKLFFFSDISVSQKEQIRI